MFESSAYKVMEDLACQRHLRELLLRQGAYKFGRPNCSHTRRLADINNLPQLERLALSLLGVNTWDELLKDQ